LRLFKKREAETPDSEVPAAYDVFDDGTENAPSQTSHAPVSPGYSRRTGRGIGVMAVLLAAGLVGGFFAVSNIRAREISELEQETQKSASELPLVDVAVVKNSAAYRPLVLPGETAAWYSTTLYSRVSGYLAEWKVDIGDRVRKGQVLATIDTPDLDAQLAAARAELKAAEAESKVKEADARFAQSSYDRWHDSPQGVVSEQEREAKKADYQGSQAKLNAALAQIAVDQAKVDGLTTLTEYKNVTAPFDGVITDRRVDPGDLVTAGSSASTTPLFIIQQSDRIRVFTSVPQNVASELTVGSDVEVRTADGTGRTYRGKIARTTGALDPLSRTMRVEVELPNSDYSLSPGMYVRTKLEVRQKKSVEVPASALVFRAKGAQVAVVGADGKVNFRDVTIVSDNGDWVDLGSGVKVGEQVALNISSQISDGDKVAVNDSSKAQS